MSYYSPQRMFNFSNVVSVVKCISCKIDVNYVRSLMMEIDKK